MKIETAEQAFDFLRFQKGFDIEKAGNDLYLYGGETGKHEYNSRELIKFARAYCEGRGKADVKKFSNSKNRTKTRDLIQREEFESIPNKNYPVDESDIWAWD